MIEIKATLHRDCTADVQSDFLANDMQSHQAFFVRCCLKHVQIEICQGKFLCYNEGKLR